MKIKALDARWSQPALCWRSPPSRRAAVINGTAGNDTLTGTPRADLDAGLRRRRHDRREGAARTSSRSGPGNDTADGGDGNDSSSAAGQRHGLGRERQRPGARRLGRRQRLRRRRQRPCRRRQRQRRRERRRRQRLAVRRLGRRHGLRRHGQRPPARARAPTGTRTCSTAAAGNDVAVIRFSEKATTTTIGCETIKYRDTVITADQSAGERRRHGRRGRVARSPLGYHSCHHLTAPGYSGGRP